MYVCMYVCVCVCGVCVGVGVDVGGCGCGCEVLGGGAYFQHFIYFCSGLVA